MIINMVMSSYVKSSIFEHIIKYFEKSSKNKIVITKTPILNADIYYYFRPHLEQRLRQNSIVTVHHDLNENDPNLALEYFLPRYKEALMVVCLNTQQKDILSSYGINNTIVIPHGYNDDILFPLPKCTDTKKTIGYFSHHYARNVKGEPYFLELLQKLDPTEIKVVLAGKKRNQLGEQIRLLGYECQVYESLPYERYNDLYSMIDVLLITSAHEGGPASIPEALATNTPIISTKVGMVNDILDNENITILTGKIDEDTANIMNVCYSRTFNEKNKTFLLTWRDVVIRYEEIFLQIIKELKGENKFSISDVFHSFDMYLKRINYLYHTMYLKKRLKTKVLQIKNVSILKSLCEKHG